MSKELKNIKSSKVSLKFSNSHKLNSISLFIKEYKKVCQYFVDVLWNLDKVPRLIEKDITDSVETWLSKRAVQSAAKQASGIVRGTRKKQKKRLFKYNEFLEKGMYKKARKIKAIIDKNNTSKPFIENLQPELDSRFVKTSFDKTTSFDGWITLSSLGNNLKIVLPFKKTKHFNLMESQGVLKKGIRLSNSFGTFMFDLPVPKQRAEGSILGIDIGMKTVYFSSDQQQSLEDKHGWNLEKIQEKLSRRKKGSHGFKKAQEHRKNYVHWSINQINLKGVKKIKIERIRHLRRGCRSSRKMSHWTYTTIFDKLKDYAFQAGVQIEEISPTYTSQRCSSCGWVRKTNRCSKQFKCVKCGFAADADLNAATNIGLDLPAINRKKRLSRINRTGFYWLSTSQDHIVPDALKG